MDVNFDELENSIVESLSEMSIASNAVLNTNNQDYLNKTISEVISTYLWSNDLGVLNTLAENEHHEPRPVPKPRNRLPSDEDVDSPGVKNAWDNRDISSNGMNYRKENSSSTIKTVHEEDDVENETPKPSPRKTSNKQLKMHSDSHFLKDDSKFQVPLLDFTPFGDVKQQQQQHKSNEHQKLEQIQNKTNSKYKYQKQDDNTQLKDKSINSDKKDKKSDFIINNNLQGKDNNNNKKTTPTQPNRFKESKSTSSANSADKNLSKNTKIEIKSLLKELKLMKNINLDSNEYYDDSVEIKLNRHDYTEKVKTMEFDLKELLFRLLEKRKQAKRINDVDKMTREEMLAEKVDTQKELLTFEAENGRPQTKLEKDLMRPLYDHYRKVKRLLAKMNNNDGQSALATEDDLPEEHNITNIATNKEHQKILRNLHSLNQYELIKERDLSLQEKNKLKEIIKKHESDFLQINGRILQKDDREFYKDDFEKYKLLKAKLKLIDALLEKSKNRDTQII